MSFLANIFKPKTNTEPKKTSWDDLTKMADNFGSKEADSSSSEDVDLDDMSDLISAMDNYRKKKQEQYEGRELQYEVERSFEDRLTKVDDLMARAEAGDPEVEKTTISYNGVEIPVLKTHGCPLAFFQTDLSIHAHTTETSQKLLDDPSFWDNSQQESQENLSTETEEDENISPVANTIHTQYVESGFMEEYGGQRFFEDQARHTLLYVFDSVKAGSMIMGYPGFISVRNNFGDKEVERHISGEDERLFSGEAEEYEGREFLMQPDELLQESVSNQFMSTFSSHRTSVTEGALLNEVVFRRYGEDGNPLYRPSAIFVQDGNITEAHLRHAAYFKVPIIDDSSKERIEHTKQILESKIDKLSEDSSYEEVHEVWRAYESQHDKYDEELPNVEVVNIEPKNEKEEALTDPIKKLSALERAKRAEYVITQIKRMAEDEADFKEDINHNGEMIVNISKPVRDNTSPQITLKIPAPKSAHKQYMRAEFWNSRLMESEAMQRSFNYDSNKYDEIISLVS